MGLTRPPGTRGTSREVLLKLDHEIAKIIMDWRQVKSITLDKAVIPFESHKSAQTHRLHGHYSHFNLNGRVTTGENAKNALDNLNLQVNHTICPVFRIENLIYSFLFLLGRSKQF